LIASIVHSDSDFKRCDDPTTASTVHVDSRAPASATEVVTCSCRCVTSRSFRWLPLPPRTNLKSDATITVPFPFEMAVSSICPNGAELPAAAIPSTLPPASCPSEAAALFPKVAPLLTFDARKARR
ncbi:hypothetical protein VaNZ11_002307, partial [Volvox africanus]